MSPVNFKRSLPQNWLRTDTIVALALVIVGTLMGYASVTSGMPTAMSDSSRDLMISAVIVSAPMVLYRRFPSVISPLASVLYIVLSYTLGIEIYSAQVVLYLAFYAVGAWENDRRRANWVRGIIVVSMAAWLLVETVRGFTSPDTGEAGVAAYFAFLFMQWIVNFAFFGAAWVFGQRAWESALERDELDTAYEQIRSQQQVIASHAIEAERVRIARELHDTVAHHVTVMGVQAAAARRVLTTDADAASQQLRAVEGSSRQAVAELQTMVHTLRDTAVDHAALPTVDDLTDLVAQGVATGQKIEYTIVDDASHPARSLSPAVELTVYRVVQESLSNARKHAGPTATATVTLRHLPGGVEIDVSDDGWGRATEARSGYEGTGTGVIGMRERVEALGGTIEAGPKTRGGWLVRAWIPAALNQEGEQ